MVRNELTIENARIIFRNFRGEATKYKREGVREFSILFDNETGLELIQDGWNLRALKPRDEDELEPYHLSVGVKYGYISPDIYLIKNNRKILLDEESVGMLDTAEIEAADLIVRPYNWTVNGKSGVKAYLKTMYVVIKEDTFANKYSSYFDDPVDNGDEPF